MSTIGTILYHGTLEVYVDTALSQYKNGNWLGYDTFVEAAESGDYVLEETECRYIISAKSETEFGRIVGDLRIEVDKADVACFVHDSFCLLIHVRGGSPSEVRIRKLRDLNIRA